MGYTQILHETGKYGLKTSNLQKFLHIWTSTFQESLQNHENLMPKTDKRPTPRIVWSAHEAWEKCAPMAAGRKLRSALSEL